MSECRCESIKNTENNVLKLKRAKAKIRQYDIETKAIGLYLQAMRNNIVKTVDSEIVTTSLADIINLNDDMDSVKENIIGNINDKISDFENELGKMRNEDYDYHEEQRKKQDD